MGTDAQFAAKILKTVFPEVFVDDLVAMQKGFPQYLDQALLRKQLSKWVTRKEEKYEPV